MMNRKKSVILVVLCCLLFVCALAATACGINKEIEMNIVGDGDAYEWKYVPAFSDECDSDTVIDGKLDETRWQDKKWLYHAEKGVQMRYTTSFSEKGLYFAAEAKDAKLQWNSPRAFMKNSSFYIYVISDKAVEYHAFDCYGFYIDEKNSRSRQTARWSAKGLRSEAEDGTPVLTAELFASWEALNYTVDETTGMPEKIRCVPQYRYVESVASADNMFLHPAFAQAVTNYPDNSFAFDGDGYINVDAEGAELGDAANGYAKSDGWDLSQINGDENGENKQIKAVKELEQAIFFKGIESSRYSYVVKITYQESIHAGKAAWGVCDMRDTNEFNVLYCNADEYTSTGTCRYFIQDFYSGASARQFGSYSGTKQNECTMRVIKDDTRYYYIINDQYQNSIEIDWLGGKTVPGLYACNVIATFSEWEVTDYEGADKDDEFIELCNKYVNMVSVSSSSGGTVTTDSMAVPKDANKEVHITVTPHRGFMLTDLTINSESIFNDFIQNMQNGVYSFVPTEYVSINAVFTELPSDKLLRITGKVKRGSGSTIVGLPYSVTCDESSVYSSGVTSSAGMIDFAVLRAGTYSLGGRNITLDGKYSLTFNGVFDEDDDYTIEINTNDDEFADKAFYTWQDITLNPYKINNMKLNDNGVIQTTHLTYDTANKGSYYLYPETLTGSFEIKMDVDAHNDKWPCYGITLEDENNNSVQFLAAGPTYYRIMSGYKTYEQIDKINATYDKYGKLSLRLLYDSVKDEFIFYVNDILFDTVKRTEYLSGSQFMYGPCGYMSGADGYVTEVTDNNPFATFTVPEVTQEFSVTIPESAELKLSDGTTVTSGKVSVCAEVNVSVPVSDELNYWIRVNGAAVETVISDGKATATFTVTENCEVTCVPIYTVTVTSGNENTKIVVVAKENGQVMFTGKGATLTLELADGDYFVTAESEAKVSKTEFTISGASQTVTVPLDKEKIDASVDEELPIPVFNPADGSYSYTASSTKQGSYFASSLTNTSSFVLTATVNKLAADSAAGFTVQTASGYLIFEVQYSQSWYLCKYWDVDREQNIDGTAWLYAGADIPGYTENYTTIDIALVYKENTYYFFVNGSLAYTVAVSEKYPAPSEKVGLAAAYAVTFTDWAIAYNVDDYFATLTLNITGDTVNNIKVLSAHTTYFTLTEYDGAKVDSVVIPKGKYKVTVNGSTTTEEFMLDSDKTVYVTINPKKMEVGAAEIVASNNENATAGYDSATDTYKFGQGAEWIAYFAEPNVTSTDSFVLTATVNMFGIADYYAGFVVQTEESKYVRFALYSYQGTQWYAYSWDINGAACWNDGAALTVTENGTIDLALVYKENKYYFFVNGVHVYTEPGSASSNGKTFPAPSRKVGLCAAHEITFTDWGYSADISGYEISASN